MKEKYDAIVVGAGPNGLALANYLMKCGLSVLVAEKRYEVGGNLITEDFGGARYNLHASYSILNEEMPPYNDLQLYDQGCSFIAPQAQATLHLKNGKAITLYRIAQQSTKSVSAFSGRDAEKLEKMYQLMKTLHTQFFLPWLYNQPQSAEKLESCLQKISSGKVLLSAAGQSPMEFLNQELGFESDELKTLLLFLGCMWGVRPDQRGAVPTFLFLLDGMLNASLIRGGSYLLAASLYKPLIMGGNNVLEGKGVTRVTIENGKATGVEFADGTRIQSPIVVSTLDVQTTFKQLVTNDHSGRSAGDVDAWKWDPWSFFQGHWTVKATPNFVGNDSTQSLMHIVGYESTGDLMAHIQQISRGEIGKMFAGVLSFPTLFDPSQAPKGLHVAKFTSLAPYEVSNGTWDSLKEDYGKKCFSAWSSLTPNITEGLAISKYMYPPDYIEMKLADCVRGSINSGAYASGVLQVNSTNGNAFSNYSTAISGFYYCGAASHPGGMVTLANAFNAAKRIAEDNSLKQWWKEPYPLAL
jgi:phytoene dehydrogenase-like protein